MTFLLILWQSYTLYFDHIIPMSPTSTLSALTYQTHPILSSFPTPNWFCVGQLLMGLGACCGWSWPTRGHTITESWLSLSQQLPNAPQLVVTSHVHPPYFTLGLCLAWGYASVLCSVTITVSSYVRLSRCVQKTLFPWILTPSPCSYKTQNFALPVPCKSPSFSGRGVPCKSYLGMSTSQFHPLHDYQWTVSGPVVSGFSSKGWKMHWSVRAAVNCQESFLMLHQVAEWEC